MVHNQSKVACVLMPFQEFQLLLPNTAIAEILPPQILDPSNDLNPHVSGEFVWHTRRIKVCNLEAYASNSNRSNLIILRIPSISGNADYLGLLSRNIPHFVQASSDSLEQDLQPLATHQIALSYVSINGQSAIIPDLSLLLDFCTDQSIKTSV